MRRLSYVFAFMLLLSMSAFATGVGDVTVDVVHEGGLSLFDGVALYDYVNIIDISIANDADLGGGSWGFLFNISYGFQFQNHPVAGQSAGYVSQHNRAWVEYEVAPGIFVFGSCWNQGGLKVSQGFDAASPDSILIGGAGDLSETTRIAWYAAGASELAYRLYLYIDPAGPDTTFDGICIDPIFYPPAGTWTSVDSAGGYAPTFNGQDAHSETAPYVDDQVCFDIIKVPCIPPSFTAFPTVFTKNHCLDYDFMFTADEGGNTPPAGPVTFSGDNIASNGAFHVDAPDVCEVDTFTVTASNTCGGTADYTFSVTFTNHDPSITNCPAGLGKVAKGNAWSTQLGVDDVDACDNFNWNVISATPAPVGLYDVTGTGLFTFNSDDADGGDTITFEVEVTDNCGGTDVCTFDVEVLQTEPFVIKLTKTHNSLQGHYEYISITKVAGSEEIGGYDFLIGYDASALGFMSATIGDAIDADDCGWEFFTYNYGAFGNCGGPCPSGYVRVVAIADQNNGPNHPDCLAVPNGGELASLKFYVTNDRTFDCQYVPVRFVWVDCGDNGLSSATGDTLFISDHVFDFEWDGNIGHTGEDYYEITGIDCDFGWGFMFGGACPGCEECHEFYPPDHPTHPGECKNQPVRFVWFWNGGVDIACSDSIDKRGDINLNGIENEIADAVLFTNFFLYGPGEFHIAFEGQVAATDVNNDGIVLSVGDLVYLIRIITGDALPFPKLAPFANAANISVVNGAVTANAGSDIGAVYAVFNVEGTYDIVNQTNMELVSNEVNGELRVLVYSGMTDKENYIPAGKNQLFTIAGNADLVKVEIADYNGNLMTANVNKTSLPTQYGLLQNVPNPFNPTTKITLELPVLTDWNVGIYNVAGQLVESFKGTDQGVVSVEWNASNVASGVYFYKMTAGDFTDTKKMVLMK